MTFYRRDTVIRRNSWPNASRSFHSVKVSTTGRAENSRAGSRARSGLLFQHSLFDCLQTAYLDTSWAVKEDIWFEYIDHENVKRLAGPDIIMLDARTGNAIVIECKLSSTDAYEQLFFYMSLLQDYLGKEWRVSGFVYINRYKDAHYSGPVEHWLGSEVPLARFRWSGLGLPLVGILSSDYVGIPVWEN